jgi:O-antigen ligase
MTSKDRSKVMLYPRPNEGSLAATFLVAAYVLACFTPILSEVGGLHWFEVFPLALGAFLLNGWRFNFRAATPFLLIIGLVLMGACLALLRAEDLRQAAWNTAALTVTLTSLCLMLPTLAASRCRRFVIIVVCVAACATALRVHNFVELYGDETRHLLTGRGNDKNIIGLIITVGEITCLSLALFLRSGRQPKVVTFSFRLGLIVIAAVLIYHVAFTFSRSALLVSLMMSAVVIGFLGLRHRLLGVALALTLGLAFAGVAALAIPKLLERLPSWSMHYDRFINWRTDDAMAARRETTKKGLLTVAENPIIGIGHGMTKGYIADGETGNQRDRLIHNGHLAMWAELGLPGLLATIGVLSVTLKQAWVHVRARQTRPWDICCVFVAMTIFAMSFFLDCSTLYWLSAGLVSGICYQQRVQACRFRIVMSASSANGIAPSRRPFLRMNRPKVQYVRFVSAR